MNTLCEILYEWQGNLARDHVVFEGPPYENVAKILRQHLVGSCDLIPEQVGLATPAEIFYGNTVPPEPLTCWATLTKISKTESKPNDPRTFKEFTSQIRSTHWNPRDFSELSLDWEGE